ncbi:MAG TPA: dihydrolipoamide acetyltransferase, partial [Psychromonas hadalis]|nr:dihydrolipoamide acetyltransferase [Psychromonas hadalis]
MSQVIEFLLPDIGADSADITEILVSVGDTIVEDQDILSIEGDKAAMDVPSSVAGVITEISVAVGDAISEGQLVLKVESGAAAPVEAVVEASAEVAVEAAPVAASSSEARDLCVPNIGGDEVEVTEVLLSFGDKFEAEQDILSVEGDKASMDVPAPYSGVVKEVKVAVGDKVSEGTLIYVVEAIVEGGAVEAPQAAAPAPAEIKISAKPEVIKTAPVLHHPASNQAVKGGAIHASPSVRRLSREFGVDLTQVIGTGRKKRILKEDVQAFVKYELSRPKATASNVGGGGNGLQVIPYAKMDYSKFGEIEI